MRANATGSQRRRTVRTRELMGTVASVHVIGESPDARVESAIEACLDELDHVESVFSPFRPESDVSRIRAGMLSVDDADPLVSVVVDACAAAKDATGGLFDAWHAGWFDPTCYVKGWAVERAARRWLEPLTEHPSVHAAGIGVGGDLQLFTAEGADWLWEIGIADPWHPGAVVATVQVVSGAVATSGTAERGSHILDPRSGAAAASVLSATVVAGSLETADLWATIAVIAGFDDLSWITTAGIRSGVLVAPDGRIRRWADGVELGPVTFTTVTPRS
ncbi:FAD:protein FMN transferase [Humibacter ginsenosidimutans]|uniref:FAD:protein FMN transferase n=2 Tax=Humibacter ginsenosidimutans TaxID=2599293 RepID=A0A5B8MAT5_9MICO|nr:FAD:protein FMN transferase [Humibacter ginsenosidimutans]